SPPPGSMISVVSVTVLWFRRFIDEPSRSLLARKGSLKQRPRYVRASRRCVARALAGALRAPRARPRRRRPGRQSGVATRVLPGRDASRTPRLLRTGDARGRL